jgi:formylglycine-generating enzyme required for sulfatase activity
LKPGSSGLLVEITRFQLRRFTVSIKELAEWFGMEIAQIVVDECLAPLREQERQWSDEEARPKADEALEKLLKFRERAIPKPGVVFRDKLKDGSRGPEMVVVPADTFKMGDIKGTGLDDEKPVHTVKIAKPFAIGRYLITFDEYDQFASAMGRRVPNDQDWSRGRQPAIDVFWDDAVEYAKWLSEQTGKLYRLSTEAEWEYAARAGTETEYWVG